MRSIAVLLALIQTLVNASCNPKGSCLSCVSAGCRWCVNTNRCVTKFAAPFKCFGEERADEWLKCPISMKQGYRYSDEFARTKMHPLSVAAYSDNPQSCLNNILKGAEVKFKITGQCHGRKPENCSGFAAISNTEKAIILSFRGSKGISQLTSQAIETAFGKSFVDLDGAGRVNSYFYRTFIYIWNAGMKESLRSMLQEHPDYEIWVTGHSLGGAMASIASTVIIRDRMHTTDKLKLVTFGQPRTGDRNYAVAHNSMVYYSYRVVHRDDAVSHIPSRTIFRYFHHRYEIWYDNEMLANEPYQLCTTEGDSCSNARWLKRSILDHVFYFGKRYSVYVKEICQN